MEGFKNGFEGACDEITQIIEKKMIANDNKEIADELTAEAQKLGLYENEEDLKKTLIKVKEQIEKWPKENGNFDIDEDELKEILKKNKKED